MSADVSNGGAESGPQTGGDGFDVPPGSGGVTDDGERYHVVWWPASATRRKAMFRVATGDRVALLQHITTVTVRQCGETTSDLDPDAELDDIPGALLRLMRADGFDPREVPQ